VLAGRCPAEVSPYFFGGRLLALDKKGGGVRPIAIGFTLRRLISKLACAFAIPIISPLLSPLQLGVGIAGGSEGAVHAARRFVNSMGLNKVFVKLDFSNAFNSLHWRDMLFAVADKIPELYSLVFSAYSSPSVLHFNGAHILSADGVQQGDPLGPLLFCLSIQPLLENLHSEVVFSYLDDVSLGGDPQTVADDVDIIIDKGSEMGLHLNASKCELISNSSSSSFPPIFNSFLKVNAGEASLLGAPLCQGPGLVTAWADRCSDLARASSRLLEICAQDGLTLLRASFSAPRVMHLLRCSPSADLSGPVSFDDLLRSTLAGITNCDLSDLNWLQASLPIRLGGLGLRRAESLALPAYLASSLASGSLQDAILCDSPCSDDPFLVAYLSVWSSLYGTAPQAPLSSKQSSWDLPIVEAVRNRVFASLSSPRERASFLAAGAPHSGDWLKALPIAACGLRLDDSAVRVGVALRLGLQLCVPHDCQCGSSVDAWGSHAFICKRASGRFARHNALNDIISRAVVAGDALATKEPAGLIAGSVKRPDGISQLPWKNGKYLAWDVTVATTLASSSLEASSAQSGSASEIAASKKVAKYQDLPSHFMFQPVAFENLGPVSASSTWFIDELGRRIVRFSGNRNESSYLWQRLSVSIQRFNSVLLSQSFIPSPAELDE